METDYNIKLVLQAQNQLSGELANVKSSIQGLESQSKSSFSAMGGIIETLAGSAGFLMLKNAIGDCIKGAQEQATVNRQLNAVLTSTHDAVGLTAGEIKNMAEQMALKNGIDDKSIQSAQNMLLTFTNIGKNIFPQATQAVLDMATAMNGGATPGADQLRAQSIQLGKALQDPILGMTALRRVGVSFTDDTKEQIKVLMQHGETLKAQTIIINELTKEFGGSAEAQATPLAKLGVAIDKLKDSIGGTLLPIITNLVNAILPIVVGISDWIEKNQTLVGRIIGLTSAILGSVTAYMALSPVIGLVIKGVQALGVKIGISIPEITAVIAIIGAFIYVGSGLVNSYKDMTASWARYSQGLEDANGNLTNLGKEFEKSQAAANAHKHAVDENNASMKVLRNMAFNQSGTRAEFEKTRQQTIANMKANIALADSYINEAKARMVAAGGGVGGTTFGSSFGTSFGMGGSADKAQINTQNELIKTYEQNIQDANSMVFTGAGAGAGSGTSKVKEQIQAVKDLGTEMTKEGYTEKTVLEATIGLKGKDKDEIKATGERYKTMKDIVQKSFDDINDKIKTSSEKIIDYKKQIIDLNAELNNLGVEQNKDVAKSYLESVQKIKDLQSKANQGGGLSSDEQAQLAQEQQNMASAFVGLNDAQKAALQSQIDAQTQYNAMTDIEKIKNDYQIKIDAINTEIKTKTDGIATEQAAIIALDKKKETIQKNWMGILAIDTKKQIEMIQSIINKEEELASYRTTVTSTASTLAGKKAEGGPVMSGGMYLVGEQGPELFVPGTSGTIVPNNQINNNGTTINISSLVVREEADINRIADALARQIQLKRNFNIV